MANTFSQPTNSAQSPYMTGSRVSCCCPQVDILAAVYGTTLERARSLGKVACATLTELLVCSQSMVRDLKETHEWVCKVLEDKLVCQVSGAMGCWRTCFRDHYTMNLCHCFWRLYPSSDTVVKMCGGVGFCSVDRHWSCAMSCYGLVVLQGYWLHAIARSDKGLHAFMASLCCRMQHET